jgi:glycosyltransferase involved in cell wall biosynthesis
MHFHRWLKYFAGRGHEMSFISHQPINDEHINQIERSGASYIGAIGPFHVKKFWKTLRSLRWLKNACKERGIDILHCHFFSFNAWYAALSGFHPLVITIMGGGDVCGPDWKPQGALAPVLSPYSLRQADLITSWSPLMGEVVKRWCRSQTPVEVTHGGVDFQKFYQAEKPDYLRKRLSLPADAKVIFSPRLMRPLSNIDRIALAAVNTCYKEPKAYFIFAYPASTIDSEYRNIVEGIIRRGGISERVRFVDVIPHDEMADYYRLADVTVSIPDTDGTPMTVLESMACGTPAVVGDIPDYDLHYIESDKTVLSVRPQDTTGLAEAILRLLEDSDLAKRLVAEAGNRVRMTGGYEAQMSRMEKLYLSLVNDA